MTFVRLFVFLILLIGGASVALVNGQGIFLYDTVSYVMGPDAAVGRLLGDNFRSRWTRKADTSAAPSVTEDSQAAPADQRSKPSSEPRGTIILSGRSIYYGTLLYLAHFSSHFWIAIFIQSAIFVYLSHTLICTCLNLSFRTFAWITVATLVLSPVSFYISFLMPDILASYLIIGTFILTIFWHSLETRHRVIIGSILLFSVLSHVTHILLLVGLICAVAGLWLFSSDRNVSFVSIRTPLLVLVAIVFAGLLGEVFFYQGVRFMTGAGPIRPPFLMARLIDDGPGYRFLQKNCEKKNYIVCRYLDRMPITSADFIWLHDPNKGIFMPADRTVKQSLSAEEMPFAFDVLFFEPIEQLFVSAQNATREFLMVGLDEFYVDRAKLQYYQDSVPSEYLEGLIHGRIVSNDKFLRMSEIVFFGVYIVSIAGLLLIGLIWLRPRRAKELHGFRKTQYKQMLAIAVTGVMLNAVICGVFGGVAERYQTRVSWVLWFMLLLAMQRIWGSRGNVATE
jgi:phage shock protein PspC (stress-responsive transcriptional regulator)